MDRAVPNDEISRRRLDIKGTLIKVQPFDYERILLRSATAGNAVRGVEIGIRPDIYRTMDPPWRGDQRDRLIGSIDPLTTRHDENNGGAEKDAKHCGQHQGLGSPHRSTPDHLERSVLYTVYMAYIIY